MTYLKITWARVTTIITMEIATMESFATPRSISRIFEFRPESGCGIPPPRCVTSG